MVFDSRHEGARRRTNSVETHVGDEGSGWRRKGNRVKRSGAATLSGEKDTTLWLSRHRAGPGRQDQRR